MNKNLFFFLPYFLYFFAQIFLQILHTHMISCVSNAACFLAIESTLLESYKIFRKTQLWISLLNSTSRSEVLRDP